MNDRDYSTERVPVSGLASEAEILVDRWGVPHIYASSETDAYFAQGWNAARDRLWQIDLWRRSGLGELSAVFGPDYVAQDRAVRHFIYRGDMEREWANYGPDAKPSAEAFAAGINAYVAATEADASLLPMEFRLADYRPALWKAEDVVCVRNHGLASGSVRQLLHAQIQSRMGALAVDDLPAKISPPWSPIIPEGLDLGSIPPNVLGQLLLVKKPVVPGTIASPTGGVPLASPQGSNNWVVGPTKTTTGRPILASDPHRMLELPSLRYIAHVVAPGLNVIGAGEPSLPGIAIGHNEHIAFGLTVFSIAQEDLCVYETDPDRPDAYRYADGWEEMTVLHETIAVRGRPDEQVTLKFTRHGPVVFEDRDKHRAYAIRAAWLDTGSAPYFGAMRYLKAKSVDEFGAALRYWGGPGENQICADTSGRIGWFPAGFTPVRDTSDGLLPLPGDGRYEWNGYMDHDLLPSETDPDRGYIATANQMNLPPDYPIEERRIGFTWADPARFDRIGTVIESVDKVSVADCAALQNDYVNLPACCLVRVLGEVVVRDDALRDFCKWLAAWDGRILAESAEAALFELWLPRLMAAALTQVTPKAPPEARLIVQPLVVAGLMENPARLGANGTQIRDRMMLDSLQEAIAEARNRLGDDRSQWQWGNLSAVHFEHPFAKLGEEALRQQLNIGPVPKSGDACTVGLAASIPGQDFRAVAGASFRMVADVGNWDSSVAVNAPGQSGDPASPHYRDLFPLWLDGKYFPLAFSRGAVEAVTERRIVLTPAG